MNTPESSPVVLAQKAEENANFDILTGLPFVIEEAETRPMSTRPRRVREYFDSLDNVEKAKLYSKIVSEPSEEYLSAALEQYSAQYTRRDSMEEAVAQAYGMDTESVKAYLASYSDDELRGMIREQLTTIIKQQVCSAG